VGLDIAAAPGVSAIHRLFGILRRHFQSGHGGLDAGFPRADDEDVQGVFALSQIRLRAPSDENDVPLPHRPIDDGFGDSNQFRFASKRRFGGISRGDEHLG
jgi:hypothetical protein